MWCEQLILQQWSLVPLLHRKQPVSNKPHSLEAEVGSTCQYISLCFALNGKDVEIDTWLPVACINSRSYQINLSQHRTICGLGLGVPDPLCFVPRGRDRPGRLANWNVLATHRRLGSSFRAISNRSADCWFHITQGKKKSIVAGRARVYSLQADINALQRRVWYLSCVISSLRIILSCRIYLNCWEWHRL